VSPVAENVQAKHSKS